MNAPRILRLVKIVDTREREERDGMYSSYSVPISGTGIERAFEEPIRYISPKGCGPRTRAPRLKGRR